MKNTIKLKIADVVIRFKSDIPIRSLSDAAFNRFGCFIYRGTKKPDIDLEVRIIKGSLPKLERKKRLFLTRHPMVDENCWAIFKDNQGYALMSYLKEKRQRIILNRAFNKGVAYLYTKKKDIKDWPVGVIIYDALQIILQKYLINHKGFLLHSMGVKDVNSKGLVFIGKSGKGKTTMAKLWHRYSNAKVLNDDRTVVRAINGSFYLYGTPWHGDFSDYLKTLANRAKLKKLLFISHSKTNRLQDIKNGGIYGPLFQNIFFTFWDEAGLKKAIDLSKELARKVPACHLGFKDTKAVIDFVRENI